jgi:hypothetical protein
MGGSDQVICQAEILSVLQVKLTLTALLQHSRTIWFIDNEAAREGLVRSASGAWASKELLLCVAMADAVCPCINWYARVPSYCNVADGPSRFLFDFVKSLGGRAFVPEAITIAMLDGSVLRNTIFR